MDIKEFGAKLVKLAPAIGGAFLGPPGAAAGGLLSVIANAFGLKDNAKPEEVYQAIQSDPEAMIKLKALEIEQENLITKLNHEREMAELKVEIENVKSARERETRIVEATGKKEINLYILAWLSVIGFFASFIVIGIVKFPENAVAISIISTLFGALIASYRDVMNYFFGSSKSSSDKTKLLVEKNSNHAPL